jgi:hypothetical protein
MNENYNKIKINENIDYKINDILNNNLEGVKMI